MDKIETLNRIPGLLDDATRLLRGVYLNDAARKALAILAAGALGTMITTIICLAFGIHNGLDPADVPALRSLFPSLPIKYFVPEPLERAQAVGFIAGAYIMSIALVLFRRLDSMILPKADRLFWVLFSVAIAGELVFGQDAFQMPARFLGTFISVWLPQYPVLWIATFLVAAFPVLASSVRLRQRANRFLAVIGILTLVLLCARMSFLVPPNGLTLDDSNHHNSAALHSVVQSSFNHIPYIDFVPQYGGYGLFALPFFRLGLDPWIALCSFLFFCYVVTFGAMVAAVALAARSWIAGIYAGIVAFWLCANFQTELSFFQGMPLRAFFPSIFLLLFSIYPRSPRLVSATSGFMIPFAIYWNPETGLVCLGAAVSFLIFDIAVHRRSDGSFYRERWTATLLFFLGCVVPSAILGAAFFLFFDRTVAVTDLFFHGVVFSKFGYFNLPIPLLDVWVPAACAFCLLLSFPGPGSIDGHNVRTRALFGVFCAMLFSGLFFYYQGRSYAGNLIGFSFPIVCGAFAWLWSDSTSRGSRCQSTARQSGFGQHEGKRPLIVQRAFGAARFFRFSIGGRDVAVLTFAVASAALAGSSFISAPFLNPFSMTMSAEDQSLRTFIKNKSTGHPAAFIVSPQAWRLHLLSGVAPPKNVPPQVGVLSRLQEEETIRAVDPESGYALFVDSKYFSQKVYSGNPFQTALAAHIHSQWERGDSLKLRFGEFTVFKPRVTSERGTSGPR
jgi:hypothetical protein